MNIRKRTAIHGKPRTKQEITGMAKPILGKLICCAKCGLPGGTLVRQSEGVYVHQDKVTCELLSRRKR